MNKEQKSEYCQDLMDKYTKEIIDLCGEKEILENSIPDEHVYHSMSAFKTRMDIITITSKINGLKQSLSHVEQLMKNI